MSQGSDPFEFIKNFWANVPGMSGAGGGPAMPSFDPADLEKRVGELKQVKQWLEMNLNMLNMQINTLEMQLTAVNSFENYTHKATHPPHEAAPQRPQYSYQPPEPTVEDNEEEDDAPPDLSQANAAAGAAAKAAGDAGADAIAQGAQALQSMPWANPGEWIKSMQAAFASANPAAHAAKPGSAASKASAKSASKTAAKPKAPARGAARKKSPARRAAPQKSPAPSARPAAAQPAAKRAAKPKRARKTP